MLTQTICSGLDGSSSRGRLLNLKLADKLLKVEEGERIVSSNSRIVLKQITKLGVGKDVLALSRVIKVVSLDVLTNRVGNINTRLELIGVPASECGHLAGNVMRLEEPSVGRRSTTRALLRSIHHTNGILLELLNTRANGTKKLNTGAASLGRRGSGLAKRLDVNLDKLLKLVKRGNYGLGINDTASLLGLSGNLRGNSGSRNRSGSGSGSGSGHLFILRIHVVFKSVLS
jgi:hypothetical protein